MIEFFPRLIGYNIFKKIGYPKLLPINLTLSITDWCNSRCKTCNIWKIRPTNELTLEEYDKIFKNYGRLFWITITGGEPFLKTEINDIVNLVYEKTRPKYMTIASNGMFTNKIVEITKFILRECPDLNLIINLSIDGIKEQHDFIRGVPGNFEKTIATFNELKKINNKKLTVGINSVISRFNVDHFDKIYDYIISINPDSYIVEIGENRAKLYNDDLKIKPETRKYIKILNYIINDLKKKKKKNTSELIRKIRIEFYKSLITGKFPPNFEGIASGYIMANGQVWMSYSKKVIIGNLREVNYDFKKLWFSEQATKMRRLMEKKDYSTMVANAFYTNLLCNPRRFLKTMTN